MIKWRGSTHAHLNFIHCSIDSSTLNCSPISVYSNDLHDSYCVSHDFLRLINVYAYEHDDFIAVEVAWKPELGQGLVAALKIIKGC